MMNIRVMTYNIQHGHVHLSDPGVIDLTKVAAVMKESGADIIGLNEVRGLGEDEYYTAQAEKIADYLGYHCWFGKSVYVFGFNPYGNAIVSKWPIVKAEVFPIPSPSDSNTRYYETRSVLRAVIETPEYSQIAVYCSHFGLTDEEHRNAVSFVKDMLSKESLPFVLMGDFNMTPDDSLIGALDHSFVSTHHILEKAGEKTFPSEAPDELIDYIYTSNDFDVGSISTIKIIASDHRPVLANLTL